MHRDTLLRRAFVLRADNLGSRVVSGAGYQFLGILLRTTITIGSTAILARLLTPADFGYIAMATVVTEFAALFSNFGFNALLIQRRVINRLKVDTVFWASVALGGILAAGVFVASYFAGYLFSDSRVGELLRVLCISFVLGQLYTVPGVVLSRLMRFHIEFWINMITVALRTSVAIGFAYAGFGVWSLVAGSLAGSALQAFLGFALVPYLPRWRFDGKYLVATWHTSGSYFGGGLLFYANMNVDLLLIGRQLGAAPLGFYQNARSLTDEIRARIAMPLQHVLFPAFSSLQTNREQMQAMVLRSGRLLAAIVFPIGVGVAALAQELVPLLYGPKWLAMIPVMGMFGLSAALKASMAIASPLFNAYDRVGLSLRFNVISSVLVGAAVWFALPHGIDVVAQWAALTSLYSVVPFSAALKLVGLGKRKVAEILVPPAVGAGLSWGVVAMLRPLLAESLDQPGAMAAVLGAGGLLVYVAVLRAASPDCVADARRLLASLVRRA